MDERKDDSIDHIVEKPTSPTLPTKGEKHDVPDYKEIEPDQKFHPLLKPKRIILRATIINDNDKSK